MKIKILLAIVACALALSVSAQSKAPKREFRGAWIQCVNGQFQGMNEKKMQSVLTAQLNALQKAGINAIIFQIRADQKRKNIGCVILVGKNSKRVITKLN